MAWSRYLLSHGLSTHRNATYRRAVIEDLASGHAIPGKYFDYPVVVKDPDGGGQGRTPLSGDGTVEVPTSMPPSAMATSTTTPPSPSRRSTWSVPTPWRAHRHLDLDASDRRGWSRSRLGVFPAVGNKRRLS